MTHEWPWSEYCTGVRRLAYSTRAVLPASRSIRWQVAAHFEELGGSKRELQWVQHLEIYEGIVDDSRAAATKLSAVVHMYTSLQGSFQRAASADVVHELVTFRQTTCAIQHDFVNRLDALQRGVKQFLVSLSSPASDRATERPRTGWVESVSSAVQGIVYHLLWTPFTYLGGMLAPKPAQGVEHVGRQNLVQNLEGTAFVEDAASAEDIVANIRSILTCLDAQKPLFAVFQQITDELIAEFDRYSAALEAAKAPADAHAVWRAHESAAARAEDWKELARVLTYEYARA